MTVEKPRTFRVRTEYGPGDLVYARADAAMCERVEGTYDRPAPEPHVLTVAAVLAEHHEGGVKVTYRCGHADGEPALFSGCELRPYLQEGGR